MLGGSSYVVKKCHSFANLETREVGNEKILNHPQKPEQVSQEYAAKNYPQTRFLLISKSRDYVSFECKHLKPTKIDAIWNEYEIPLIMEREIFNIYYYPSKSLIIFENGKKTVNDLILQLHRHHKEEDFNFQSLKFNFSALDNNPNTRDSTNAWFNTRGAYTNIATEAVFGNRIKNDNEFQRLQSLAFLTSSRFIFNFNNIEIIVQLSHGVSIWFPKSMDHLIELDFLIWLSDFMIPFKRREESSVDNFQE